MCFDLDYATVCFSLLRVFITQLITFLSVQKIKFV